MTCHMDRSVPHRRDFEVDEPNRSSTDARR